MSEVRTVKNFLVVNSFKNIFHSYKGFLPCWIRMAPWSLTFWLSFEQIRIFLGDNGFCNADCTDNNFFFNIMIFISRRWRVLNAQNFLCSHIHALSPLNHQRIFSRLADAFYYAIYVCLLLLFLPLLILLF